MTRRRGNRAIPLLLACVWLSGCHTPGVQGNACDPSAISLQLAVINAETAVVSTTTYNGSGAGGGTTVSIPDPSMVVLDLELIASLGCTPEGAFHATLTTSTGSFTNGVVSSAPSGGKSDAGTTPGSSGVAGTSVGILMTNGVVAPQEGSAGEAVALDAGPFTLGGEASLQVTSDRTIQIQAILGDTSACWQIEIRPAKVNAAILAGEVPTVDVSPPIVTHCAGS